MAACFDSVGNLPLDNRHCRLRERWMQLIVSKQRDTPLEILSERLYREIGARPFPRAYRIQRLFEGDAVELFTPVRK